MQRLLGRYSAIFPLLLMCNTSLLSAGPGERGVDHGEIAPEHNHDTEKFINSRFKINGQYSAEKIKEFILQLRQDRDKLQKDLYETKLFESTKVRVLKSKKAKKEAEQEADPARSEILRGMDEYLIPIIENLYTLVSTNSQAQRWDAIVADFLRGYHTYYLPNAFRSRWPNDTDIPALAKRVLTPYHFKKQDYTNAEAFNLQVSPEHQGAISACLHRPIALHSYLSQQDLKDLVACRFDISKLDPGYSLFWHQPTSEEQHKVLQVREDLFPTPNEKIYFQRVRLRSVVSPKLTAYFMREGKKHKFKIKMGQETTVDPALCRILKLLGWDQDHTKNIPRVRVYFEKGGYEEFVSEFTNKYQRMAVPWVISAHGTEEDMEWVEFEDVMFEGRPKEELRVSPVDLWAWDFTNRREYRAMLMTFAWLGINDMQTNNFKQMFRETPNGLEPFIRIQDVGKAFGAPFRLNKYDSMFGFGLYYRPNAFPISFMDYDAHKDETKIWWDDFAVRDRNFKATTWSDLRWAARKIAQLDSAQLKAILLDAGMPNPVAILLHFKLLARRNEMIKHFDLDKEFTYDDVPDFKKFSMEEDGELVIKNGRLVKTAFKGKNAMLKVGPNWLTLLPQVLTFNTPIEKWNINNNTTSPVVSILPNALGANALISIKDFAYMNPVTSIPIGAGIQATFSRSVVPNLAPMVAQGQTHQYQVTDSVSIKVAIDSPIFRKIVKSTQFLDANIALKFFEKRFEFIHYADTTTDAYLSKFKLPQILADINKYVAFHLEPTEVIRSFNKFGFDFNVEVGLGNVNTFVTNQVGVSAGSDKILSSYYTRDQFGEIHYFVDTGTNNYAGINLGLGTIGDSSLINVSLLQLSAGYARFSNHQRDWVFKLPVHDRENVEVWKNDIRQYEEYMALNTITEKSKGDDLPEWVDVRYAVDAKGTSKVRSASLFFLFNHYKSEQSSRATVKLPDGEIKSFYRLAVTKNKYVGLDGFLGSFPTYDLFVKNRRRTKIDVEMDEEEWKKFTISVKTEDYFSSRDLAKVNNLLNDLNFRYSKNKDVPFYRNYTLPTAEEVDKYPMVYGLHFTVIYGRTLLDTLKELSLDELRQIATEHFSGTWYLNPGDSFPSGSMLSEGQVKARVDKVIGRIGVIWQLLEQEKSPERTKTLSKALTKLVTGVETEVFGLHFFRRLFPDGEGMFVMGEVAGLLRSFSMTNDMQQEARRRFMGESWGEIKGLPPLQKFLRKHRLVPPSAQIQKIYSDSLLFGTLENGVPSNLDYIYDNNQGF
jgi:hypothetical protein